MLKPHRIQRLLVFTCFLITLPFSAGLSAQEPVSSDDPVLESRLQDLWAELRCMKCQAQSVGDSRSKWATDLRKTTREAMVAGKSEEEILADLKAAYGDSVSYLPPFKPSTYILWIGPILLLLVSLATVAFLVKRKGRKAPDALSADEHREAETLLGGDEPKS